MTRPRIFLIGLVLVIGNQLFAVPEFNNDEMVLPTAVAGQPYEYNLTQLLKPTADKVEFTIVYPPDFPSWLSVTKEGTLYGAPALDNVGHYVFEVIANNPGDRETAHLSTMITVSHPTEGINPLDRVRP